MKIAWFNKPSTSKTPAEPELERLDRLEAGFRSLQLEWEDTYERVMRALRRLNKRAQDAEAREEREAAKTSQEPARATNGGQLDLDPISAAIHARRARVPPRHDG